MEFSFGPSGFSTLGHSMPQRLSETRFTAVYDGGSAGRAKVISVDPATGALSVAQSSEFAGGFRGTCSMLGGQKFLCFGQPGVKVCSFDGVSISFGPTWALPFVASYVKAAALSPTMFVLAGFVSSTQAIRVVIGTVTGTSVAFGAPVTAVSSGSNSFDVKRLSEAAFALAYLTSSGTTSRVVVGTRSGTTITIDLDGGANIGAPWLGFDVVDSSVVVVAYSSGGRGYARCGLVNGRTVTLASPFDLGAASLQYSLCTLSPQVAGLFPKKIVVGYHVSNYPDGDMYVRGLQVSVQNKATLALSADGAASYTGLRASEEVNGCNPHVVRATERLAACFISVSGYYPANNLYGITMPVAHPLLALSLDMAEALAAPAEATQMHAAMTCNDEFSLSSQASRRVISAFSDLLETAEEPADMRLILQRVLVELLKTAGRVDADGVVIGDDVQEWIYFAEVAGIADTVRNHVALARGETIITPDRLRLGGVFDNPTTKIITSILKAAIGAERL